MRVYDIIAKKRDGKRLTSAEIDFMVQGYTQGTIPDYQMAAFLMAVYLNDLNEEEIADLIRSMIRSGKTIDLSSIPGIKVDKHSTGGVGDSTTLILAPLVAAAGVPIAKISGKGLGHTGGTLDKLESIPGFRTELNQKEFIAQVEKIGLAVISQTEELVPADKKIYALRDATATVSSIPLITSSIMSKKIASGADVLVLDVKTGSGAFVKTLKDTRRLAERLATMGTKMGKRVVAVISDMNQPLGFAIGNSLEVEEAIATLRGKGPLDLLELCLALGSYLLNLSGVVLEFAEARKLLEEKLSSGEALGKLAQLIEAQGGDVRVIERTDLLPQASIRKDWIASKEGFIVRMDAEKVGEAAMELGAGRKTKEDRIDPAAGLILRKKEGDYMRRGEKIGELHTNDSSKLEEAKYLLDSGLKILEEKPKRRPLIYAIIGKN